MKQKDEKINSTVQTKKTKKRYSTLIKEKAIRMVNELGCTYSQAADQLGCNQESVRRWVLQQRSTLTKAQQEIVIDGAAEMKKLKAENARLKMEVEILKKATAYFAKETM
jgi:transposase